MTDATEEHKIHNPGNLISPDEAVERHANGAVLIDVRGPITRGKQGLVDDAIVIDKARTAEVLNPDSDERIAQLTGDLDQDVVVFCGSEFGSDPVVDQLKEYGYQNVHQIAGGITRWLVEGKPTTPAPATSEV
ncbi:MULTISPECIES: rhodanese-like domain-containing protein [unclassified Pseudoclavibacter]|uniref:rhodanese-like domain-containing protein n=1 Tax=unclassified Pseudoclavibacter TaxID=2615177 RepID=UPI001300E004|nr:MULTISPECIES: rhodanese-like domain-containing protein [unclassified Pseudoclavibacter]KAB1656975.1 sulfurtransferase [Pseudoclavibacter sp. CFCC 11306]KAB1659789.1 sulfurtransferase [Pseudoclavibacter sp. CFCC 13796]